MAAKFETEKPKKKKKKFETAHESLGTEIGALRRLTLFGFNTQYQTRRK